MLDIKFIVNNPDIVNDSIEKRHMSVDISSLTQTYKEKIAIQQETEEIRAQVNKLSKEAPTLKDEAEKAKLFQTVKGLKQTLKDKETTQHALEETLSELSKLVPNLLPDDTPLGKDDGANLEIETYLEPTTFSFTPKDHLELGTSLDLIDFPSGSKTTGNKFYFLKNELVILEFALVQYALSLAVKAGYSPLITPDICRNDVLEGSGFNPRGNEANTYPIEGTDYSLIATSEIQVGGMYQDMILDEAELPIKHVAYSHCFRRESGAAGQASKGLYRVHQFTKVELYQITASDQSHDALEDILALEKAVYQGLKIPYRVVRVASGDLGAPAYKKYDIEAWMPGKGENGEYGEITSASNCTDFQSRRLKLRYKDADKKKQFAHTLNGTATAISRTLVAILENFQNEDGSISVPDVLQPYTGFDKISPKA